jgi:anthranilate synthase/aminodeoxychorismate synthase-like glutamine amidotransferase
MLLRDTCIRSIRSIRIKLMLSLTLQYPLFTIMQVVLSPGPGNPTDFALSKSVDLVIHHRIPCFGVCLGLQGMVEHFGGKLGVLGYPMHGKPSEIALTRDGLKEKSIFTGLPERFEVARYHSLHGIREHMPKELLVTAVSEDGTVMGIQHASLPFAAVQFHPESILTSPAHGMAILENALKFLKYPENDLEPKSGAQLVGELEQQSVDDLRSMLEAAGLSTSGSKSELVIRLALYTHKRTETLAGRLNLRDMTTEDLKELATNLGMKRRSGVDLLETLERALSTTH